MKHSTCFLCILALVCLLFTATASAETGLPYQLRFGLKFESAAESLNDIADFDINPEDNFVTCYTTNAEKIVGNCNALNLTLTFTANNSNRALELDLIDFELPVGENVIAAFRDALAEFTAVYGEPDSDPFDDVDGYVEYGTLNAYWTFSDVRIALNMQRMYSDRISAYFSRRICYNADDLK